MRGWVGALLMMTLVGSSLEAAQVRIFRARSQQAFLSGTLEGVSIDPLGNIRLAPRAERLASISEPFVLDAARHPQGWVLGTGNEGRVLLVSRQGEVTELFEAPEPEVFAVYSDPDGTVYAGTSPGGRVYRISEGDSEVLFDPGETYIWDLAKTEDGDLLVATGTQGRLYAIDGQRTTRVVWDSDDTHVRAIQPLADGAILAGTAGEGLVVRIDRDGGVQTLYDAAQPEVVAFATAPDGTSWAAAVASEASSLQLGADAKAEQKEGGDQEQATGDEEEEGDDGEGEVVVVVESGGQATPTGSRPPGFRGPRSQLFRISPEGLVEPVWRFDEETVFSLLWANDRLWVGTGLEGKVFSYADDQAVLVGDVEERQVMALVPDGTDPAFATTNAAAFYRLVSGKERRGDFVSPVLDAGQIARFGSFRWLGEAPEGSAIRFAFRSGMSAEPDRTWSAWSEPRAGRDLSLAGLPTGRFVQWKAELSGRGKRTPTLAGADLSYRQQNLPPRISSFEVLPPGQVLVAYNFNPASQIFEPAHPNRQGIFTTLRPADTEDRRYKPVWKRGFRTLKWEAEDPNDDTLVYSIDFRSEAADGPWLPVASELEESPYSFDVTGLPDGIYRFRLSATDAESNSGHGEEATRVSEPVVVDLTPPREIAVRRQGERLLVEVEDGLNPLREAEVSVDAGEWHPVGTQDGLLDGHREVLVVPVPEGAHLLLLRVMDAAFNAATFDLLEEPP